MEIGSYVEVIDLDLRGRVINIRSDDRHGLIFTVVLDDVTATSDGIYVARDFELRAI